MYHWESQVTSIDVPLYGSGLNWRGGEAFPYLLQSYGPLSDTQMQLQFTALENQSREKSAAAIAMTNPSVPTVDLGSSIGEILTGGLPSLAGRTLWKERSNLARGAGSEYLNYQFGWAPLVRDIRDTATVVRDLDDLIAKYEAGSGKDQHRQVAFPSDDTFTFEEYSGLSNVVGGGGTSTWYNGGGSTISTTVQDRIWFSACFRYYLPKSGFARHRAIADKFFGADLTPQTLWNLTPWSWALDWEGNIGDIMTNLAYLGKDASVMKYGYMMHERIKTVDIQTLAYPRPGTPVSGPPRRTSALIVESFKTRIKASPYSFSVNPEPLTGKQAAIVAALGLSRT